MDHTLIEHVLAGEHIERCNATPRCEHVARIQKLDRLFRYYCHCCISKAHNQGPSSVYNCDGSLL